MTSEPTPEPAAIPPSAPPRARTDRILPYTRVVSVIIIPFLVVASVLLYVLPDRTDELFAWTIAPPLTAMLLGCAYLGGIWFFAACLRLRRWHAIGWGFPAVFVFASLLAIATFLHWDRFHSGHISFIVWVTLYVTTPVLVLVAFILNRPQDSGAPDARDYPVPRWLRGLLAVIGLLAAVIGVVLFVAPQLAIEIWAWELTPLTARVAGAILTLPGMVNVWLFVDARWSAFRSVVQAELISLVFIVAALLIRWNDLLWERPSAPLFFGGIVVSLLAYAAFYAYCEWRLRRVDHSAQATSAG
ncbi:hypothetical protein ACEXOS_021280 [Herbiconiux sp. P16]|uniref:hypothetical protein n=1 Tax=Herbiconiux wuyangfengii TaxID=3342794 RepID=UPI0035BAFD77